MQRLEDKAFRTLSSSASSASAASKWLLERGLSKLKAGRAKKISSKREVNKTMIDWLCYTRKDVQFMDSSFLEWLIKQTLRN